MTFLNILGSLSWLAVGAAAYGSLKILLEHEADRFSVLTLVISLVGAFVGGSIFSHLSFLGMTYFHVWSLFAAFVGAITVLVPWHMVQNVRPALARSSHH